MPIYAQKSDFGAIFDFSGSQQLALGATFSPKRVLKIQFFSHRSAPGAVQRATCSVQRATLHVRRALTRFLTDFLWILTDFHCFAIVVLFFFSFTVSLSLFSFLLVFYFSLQFLLYFLFFSFFMKGGPAECSRRVSVTYRSWTHVHGRYE